MVTGSVFSGALSQYPGLYGGNAHYPHTPRLLPVIEQDQANLTAAKLFSGIPTASTATVQTALAGPLRVQLEAPDHGVADLLASLEGLSLVEGQPDILVRWEHSDAVLFSGAGDLIVRLVAADASTVAHRIQKALWSHQLLTHPDGKAEFELRLELDGGGVARAVGTPLELSLRTTAPAYVLLLDIDARGNVLVLYPNKPEEVTALELLQFPTPEWGEIVITPPFWYRSTDRVCVFRAPGLIESHHSTTELCAWLTLIR